ncbi:MAG: hypothetical protein R2712_20690 [Vicinamibacterales bacterium]
MSGVNSDRVEERRRVEDGIDPLLGHDALEQSAVGRIEPVNSRWTSGASEASSGLRSSVIDGAVALRGEPLDEAVADPRRRRRR